MAVNRKIKIIAFVGLVGAGKTSAANYLASRGMPKVKFIDADQAISELQNLVKAGQYHLVLNSMPTFSDYRKVKRAFPGSVTVVALTPDKAVRYSRLRRLLGNLAKFRDQEQFTVGKVIANADYTINTSSSESDLHQRIDEILKHTGILS